MAREATPKVVKLYEILLTGGGKDSQQQDIEAAKGYWKEYKDNA